MEDNNENETKPACQKLYAVKQGKYFIRHRQADKGADAGSGQTDAYYFFKFISAALKQKHEYEIYGDIPYDRA